jgi:hypothetical protein
MSSSISQGHGPLLPTTRLNFTTQKPNLSEEGVLGDRKVTCINPDREGEEKRSPRSLSALAAATIGSESKNPSERNVFPDEETIKNHLKKNFSRKIKEPYINALATVFSANIFTRNAVADLVIETIKKTQEAERNLDLDQNNRKLNRTKNHCIDMQIPKQLIDSLWNLALTKTFKTQVTDPAPKRPGGLGALFSMLKKDTEDEEVYPFKPGLDLSGSDSSTPSESPSEDVDNDYYEWLEELGKSTDPADRELLRQILLPEVAHQWKILGPSK